MPKQLEQSAVAPVDEACRIDLEAVNRSYRSALNAYFRRRIANPHEVDDLTQEVFFRLSRREERTQIHNIEPFVFQIASRVLANYVRRRMIRERSTAGSSGYDDLADEGPSPERIAMGRDTLHRVERAIATLPERVQYAFLLYRFHDMKQVDIAQQMGISLSMVEKHIRTGMLRLVAAMKDME